MVYGLPAHGEPNWDTKLNDSIAAVKSTADAAQPAASLESAVAAKIGTAGSLDTALTASYVKFDLRPSGDTTGAADSAALASLLTAAAGGLRAKQIVALPGLYYFNSAPVFGNGVHLECFGGALSGGAGFGAVFRYVGPTATRFVDARNCIGLIVTGVVIETASTLTGTLVDLGGAQFCTFEQGVLQGVGTAAPPRLVDLPLANQITFEKINFLNAVDGVRGISATTGQYAEIIRFNECNFGTMAGSGSLSGVALRNPNTDWVLTGCNFEPSTTGEPNAVGFDTTAYPCNTLTFLGCWFGDLATTATAPWINFVSNWANGLSVLGCNISVSATTPVVSIGGVGDQFGFTFTGNTITCAAGNGQVGIDFHLGGLSNALVAGNAWRGMLDTCLDSAKNIGSGLVQRPNGELVLGGRIIKGYSGGTPTLLVGPALGTTPPAPTITGDDTRGTVRMGTGTATNSTARMVTVTFAKPYPVAPSVTVTPVNTILSAQLQMVAVAATTTGFEVWCTGLPPVSAAVGDIQFTYGVTG